MAPFPRTRRALALALPACAGVLWLVASRPRELPGRATIVSPRRSTVIGDNGAVRSVQSARLAMPQRDLDRLWTARNLENLGATYWRFLTRVTLGIVQVLYSPDDRRVALFGIRALTLLRFDPPTFVVSSRRARIGWQIKDGLLVARRGRGEGGLALEVTREPAGSGPDGPEPEADARDPELTIEVEVTNFYPSIASSLGDLVYQSTQAFVHVLVTNAFLRSLASLELHESKIGRLLVGGIDADPAHPA
ncbi:hypothetical protein [Conexibacter sp. DBS9H8]|uniref:hypothetical protein n=1 Tax=Conexibacter sp. DBS9H8 TaxID=2937801 RepID=UPI00201062A7|nr:hypothetical protein [Conexibacter sp. DBS9H8]